MSDDNDFATFRDNDADLYENLPGDPERAFLILERHFRRECADRVAKAHQEENVHVYYVDYIAQVLASITELGIAAEFDQRVPQIADVDYNTYLNFSKDVEHYRTMLEIRHGRRVQGYSVRFDAATKEKVRHHLKQLRSIFDKLEVDDRKREDLFDKLNELEQEVDRDRTGFDKFAALAIETAGVIGEATEKSKVLNVLDAIARVFWGAKTEDTKRLPSPTSPKRIEPPRAPAPTPKRDDMNDEIPF
jgi:hypothetical protein